MRTNRDVSKSSRSDRFDIAPALPVVTREHRLWRVGPLPSAGALSVRLTEMPRRPRRRSPRPLLYDVGLDRRRAACAAKERYASEAEARSIALMNAPPGRRASTTRYHYETRPAWRCSTKDRAAGVVSRRATHQP